ncbi:Ankyrin repeat and LEM domain-containing protein 1 [Chionoecetes opilio]|uniref:Ankyrin repeat and LEM domain-containing protein 1 n=1 Tax=Chionoecetes opilio TaxID=41210 RepID=A0A8J4Y5I7_CHIOP|nr:Ankyrin repeat and LEM domain-containing protein 1 [Chionoecetes opilio]
MRCLQRTVGEGNADVFVRVDGTTSLHLAAALPQQADSITVATVLLSSGANPNIPNKEGKTSMHVAAFMGYTDLLQLLLLNGGDPLLGDLRGCSSVDSAFQGNHQDTLKFLNHLLDTEEYSSEKNLQFTLSFKEACIHCEPPPWLSSSTFLGSLKRQVEVFQGDTSDSEHDLRTLHSYLGWTLRQDEHWCQNTDSEIESTFRELNIAHLNEFLYKDKETGIQLIERRCPAVAVLSSSNGTSHGASNRGASGHVEVLEERASEKSFDSIGPLTDTIKAMSVEVLRDNLNKLGFEPGPIMPSTHTVYMRHLVRLRRRPCSSPEKQSSPPQYCKEVRLVLRQPHAIPWDAWTALEEEMSRPFSQPDRTRHWRDGVNKSCFNYLLLDPRITQNLPLM